MFDTMTLTKVTGAVCGSLLVYLFGAWAAETLYHTGAPAGHGGEEVAQAYTIETGEAAPTEAAEAGPVFGEVYAAYAARTPRFGPNFRLWRDEPELTVRPEFFLTTIRDGLMLLVALPVFELIDQGQADGWLRVLLHLP